jgi:hypothetical protein
MTLTRHRLRCADGVELDLGQLPADDAAVSLAMLHAARDRIFELEREAAAGTISGVEAGAAEPPPPSSSSSSSPPPPPPPAAAAESDGAPVAAALATSCLVPRGKFDLVLTDGGVLRGSSPTQHFCVHAQDMFHMASVPKGDSVKPLMLMIVQLRSAPVVHKVKGGSKAGPAAYLVMQFAQKDFEAVGGRFVSALSTAAKLQVASPSDSVFRTLVAKPNQPSCAIKVRSCLQFLLPPLTVLPLPMAVLPRAQ